MPTRMKLPLSTILRLSPPRLPCGVADCASSISMMLCGTAYLEDADAAPTRPARRPPCWSSLSRRRCIISGWLTCRIMVMSDTLMAQRGRNTWSSEPRCRPGRKLARADIASASSMAAPIHRISFRCRAKMAFPYQHIAAETADMMI